MSVHIHFLEFRGWGKGPTWSAAGLLVTETINSIKMSDTVRREEICQVRSQKF